MQSTYLANPVICLPALQMAESMGLSADSLLQALGLDVELQRQLVSQQGQQPRFKVAAEFFLSTDQQIQFVRNLQQCFSDPAAGLLIGGAAKFSDLGILGLTMLSAPSLRQAAQIGGLYSHIGGTLNSIYCVESSSGIAYIVEPPDVDPALQRYIVEEQFASFDAYLQELQQPANLNSQTTARLKFSYPKPEYYERYQRYFSCPVEFDCQRNEYWINSELLAVPARYANHDAFELCSRQCQGALDALKENDSLIRALKYYIGEQPSFPKLDNAARYLGYSSRALRRKLEDLGSGFSALVTEVKTAQAQLLLRKSDLSIREVSELLGYTEVTNFRRAYRSWTGASPSDYRLGLVL